MKFPKRITIELTNRCNMHCSYCPRRFWKNVKEEDINAMLFYKIAQELHKHKDLIIVPFFRGETTINPHWITMIDLLNKLGKIQFATNTTLLHPDDVKELIAMKIDFISFSIQRFHVIPQIVYYFFEQNRKAGFPVQMQISTVNTEKKNYDKLIEQWHMVLDPVEIRVYTEHSKDGKFGSIENITGREYICYKPFEEIVILSNGNVTICCHSWEGNIMGNIKDNTIEEIWNSSKYTYFREQHEYPKEFKIKPICKTCNQGKRTV